MSDSLLGDKYECPPALWDLDNYMDDVLRDLSKPKNQTMPFKISEMFKQVAIFCDPTRDAALAPLQNDMAEVLQRYIPPIYNKINNRHYSARTREMLFNEFSDFMLIKKVMPDTIADFVMTNVNNWLVSAASDKEMSFLLYRSAVRTLSDLTRDGEDGQPSSFTKISHERKEDIRKFISEQSADILVSYAKLSVDGVDRRRQNPEMAKVGKNQSTRSYAEEAVDAYGEMVELIPYTMEKSERRHFAEAISSAMNNAVTHAKTGYWNLNETVPSIVKEYLKPDNRTKSDCLIYSLQALRSGATKSQFLLDVYEETDLCDQISENIRRGNAKSSYELYATALRLLAPAQDEQRRFASIIGTRCARDMLQNDPEYAAKIIEGMRDLHNIEKDDIVMLMDPTETETQKPLAFMVSQKQEVFNHDISREFFAAHNNVNIFVKGSTDDEPEFEIALQSADLLRKIPSDVYDLRQMFKLNLNYLQVQKHNNGFYSCPKSTMDNLTF